MAGRKLADHWTRDRAWWTDLRTADATREVRRLYRDVPTRDLLADLEAQRWLALELSDTRASRQCVEERIREIVDELDRRQRLLRAGHDDPLAPRWPKRDEDLRARVEAVKREWPIVRFAEQLLGGGPAVRCGGGRWRMRCPLPGHDEATASFVLYPDDHAWCFGCQRGGDVITLTGYCFGLGRFYDALERLERESGITAAGQTG